MYTTDTPQLIQVHKTCCMSYIEVSRFWLLYTVMRHLHVVVQTRHSPVVRQICEGIPSAWCWEVLHRRVSPTSGNSAVYCVACSAWTQTQTHWSSSQPEYCTQPTKYHTVKENPPLFSPCLLPSSFHHNSNSCSMLQGFAESLQQTRSPGCVVVNVPLPAILCDGRVLR